MAFLGEILEILVNIYVLIIIVHVALSWLVAFDIVNADNDAARNLTDLLRKLTDPVYKPIRKYVPPIGGIDITPLVVIIGLKILLYLLQSLLGSF